jgi:hypothetical protein
MNTDANVEIQSRPAAISSGCAEEGPPSLRLNDNKESAAEGLGLGIDIAYSACEEDGSVSAGLNDNVEPAVAGLRLGIGIATSGGQSRFCRGWKSEFAILA